MTKKEIAAILKKLRTDAGLTQKEVAKKLGRPQQTLASWETGQSQPDANTLFMLCDIYDVSVDVAFGFSAPPSITLSPAEVSFIKKYRALPPAVQDIVSEMVDREYEKISPASDNISNVG